MGEKKFHFEQVPVALARAIANQAAISPPVSCAICGQPVALELCKTNENGRAVHEKCYIAKVSDQNSAT
jgi:hypothetical protein